MVAVLCTLELYHEFLKCQYYSINWQEVISIMVFCLGVFIECEPYHTHTQFWYVKFEIVSLGSWLRHDFKTSQSPNPLPSLQASAFFSWWYHEPTNAWFNYQITSFLGWTMTLAVFSSAPCSGRQITCKSTSDFQGCISWLLCNFFLINIWFAEVQYF